MYSQAWSPAPEAENAAPAFPAAERSRAALTRAG